MPQKRVGVAVRAPGPAATVSYIENVERLGIHAAWMTGGMDAMTIFSAAAVRTESIMLGTSIVPILPRHPIVTAQQAQAVADLAPGRLRVGVGPSHRPSMRATYNFELDKPLTRLREYVRILKPLLETGQVDFKGGFYSATYRFPAPPDRSGPIPVMVSALRHASFRLAGEESDGAISWVVPMDYLVSEALPAMQEGAAAAGRETPPLVAHALLCVHEDRTEVMKAVQEQFAVYPRLPYYAAMFERSGYPPGSDATWTEAMFDAIVVTGSASQVTDRLLSMLDRGASELVLSIVRAGPDADACEDRTLKAIADASAALR